MTRLCLIGDSHLAALKSGWAPDAFPTIEPTFFAAPAKYMGDLAVADGALEASDDDLKRRLRLTSGDLTRIAGDYDRYLVHGLELSLALVLDLCRQVPGMRNSKSWQARVAAPSFMDTVDNVIRGSLAIRTAAKLRQVTAAPITLSPTPVSSARYPNLRLRLSENGNAQIVADMFSDACRRAALEVKAGFLPQPTDTLDTDGLATKPIYSREPARFLIPNAAEDLTHMNGEYGATVLRALLADAAGAKPERSDSRLRA